MAYGANFHKMKHHKRSFTLLETIVAIYILLAGVVGAMSLAQQNISAITLFRHQLIAANLAQEGAELVRNKRDSNALAKLDAAFYDPSINPNTSSMSGISDKCTGIGCRVNDPFESTTTFIACDDASTCEHLLLNSSGQYQYAGGTQTIFDRRIAVSEVSGDYRVDGLKDWRVTSTVSWCEKLDCTKKVEVVEVLTPSIPRS